MNDIKATLELASAIGAAIGCLRSAALLTQRDFPDTASLCEQTARDLNDAHDRMLSQGILQ